MDERNAHRWECTARYGYATIYRCEVCKCSRHYSWNPGWPGGNDYFSAEGNGLPGEPPCSALPVDGLFAKVS